MYELGEKLYLQEEGWLLVAQVFSDTLALYSIQDEPRLVYANKNLSEKNAFPVCSPQIDCHYIPYKGKRIYSLRHLKPGTRVFYYTVVDGSQCINHGRYVCSDFKTTLIDTKGGDAVEVATGLVRAYV